MAINFDASVSSLTDGAPDDDMLSEINTTPLVDVMLVLLIIFLITIPVVNASVSVSLPRETSQLRQAMPETIVLSVDASGTNFWFDAKLNGTQALQQRLARVAAMQPQPEVHIRADARADYAHVARVVLACQQAGIVRIGFLTQPPASP